MTSPQTWASNDYAHEAHTFANFLVPGASGKFDGVILSHFSFFT